MKRLTKAPRASGKKLIKRVLNQTARALVTGVLGPTKRTPARAPARAVPRATSRAAPRSSKPAQPNSVLPRTQRALAPAGVSWQQAVFVSPQTAQIAIPKRLTYWLFLPSAVRRAEAGAADVPLVVMLHGCKQTALDIAAATRMNALGERKGFAVLYPHQSSSADTHRCWHWYKRGVQRGEGDVALIAQLIEQVQQRHGLNRSRTYAAGLSAGAALATILALRHPGLIAAVGLHSAPVFATSDSALSAYRTMQQGSPHAHSAVMRDFLGNQSGFPGMPVMVIHGDRDDVVRRVNADELTQQFLMVNTPQLTRTEPTHRLHAGRPSSSNARLPFHTDTWYAGRKPYVVNCMVNGLGHAWSGGAAAQAFTEPDGPNASRMLWAFFERHQRAAVRAPGR